MRTRLVISHALVAALLAGVVPSSAQTQRALVLESIETDHASPGLALAVGDLCGLTPGQEIEAGDLRTARRTIARSGWFEDVEVYTRPGSAPGRLVLRVEGPLDEGLNFETGVGHDPLDGWYLNLLGLRVQHMGTPGSTARANLQYSERRVMARAEFELPRVGGSDLDLLFDAGGGHEDWFAYDGDRLYTQRVRRGYARLGARVHLTAATALTFWVGGSRADPDDPELQAEDPEPGPPPDLVGAHDGLETYADTRVDLTWDRRHRVQPWRRGVFALLRAETSRPDDGPVFVRTRAAFRGALPLPGQQALALRVDASWADRGTPYHRRPVFGGLFSVRGFRDASLSGGRGARAVASSSLEWRVPLLPRASVDPRVHGVLFVDAGRFVDADGQLADWATSVGWGVRVRLPWIERISFDAGIPLTPTATEDAFWVHGSLGFGF